MTTSPLYRCINGKEGMLFFVGHTFLRQPIRQKCLLINAIRYGLACLLYPIDFERFLSAPVLLSDHLVL